MNEREELIVKAASKVHEDWCMSEYRAFFERGQQALKNGAPRVREALEQACFKGEQKRNEVYFDTELLVRSNATAQSCLDDFDIFMTVVGYGGFEVARFAKRTLTPEEQTKAGIHYKKETGEENILRPFLKLSADSKKENLDAAIGAFNVYEELSKAGISIEQMQSDSEILGIIGVAIHADWLKRNMDHPNDSLKVPYDQLDSWTQQQDITVFNALLSIVKEKREKYAIAPVEGYELPDYVAMEQEVLGLNAGKAI